MNLMTEEVQGPMGALGGCVLRGALKQAKIQAKLSYLSWDIED